MSSATGSPALEIANSTPACTPVAITQIAHDTPGRAYYQRKRAAGKSHREALRCLKRRLSDVVYRQLVTDAGRDGPGTGPEGQAGATESCAPGPTPTAGSSDKSLPGPSRLTLQRPQRST